VPTLAPDLGTLDIPVLVVWGAQDAVISSALAAAASASARLEIIPAVGHSPHVEAPGEVRRILIGFFGNLAER
jgi:pimeloyl-ACP methyl ester carboxylesterase